MYRIYKIKLQDGDKINQNLDKYYGEKYRDHRLENTKWLKCQFCPSWSVGFKEPATLCEGFCRCRQTYSKSARREKILRTAKYFWKRIKKKSLFFFIIRQREISLYLCWFQQRFRNQHSMKNDPCKYAQVIFNNGEKVIQLRKR
jgi:hypothetical protein